MPRPSSTKPPVAANVSSRTSGRKRLTIAPANSGASEEPAPGGIPARFAALGKLDPRACLKAAEVAILLGVSLQHVYDLIEEGKLRALDISGGTNETDRRCLRIPAESLRAFMEKSEVLG